METRLVNRKEAMQRLGIESYDLFRKFIKKLNVKPIHGRNLFDYRDIERVLDNKGNAATSFESADNVIFERLKQLGKNKSYVPSH